MNTNKCVYALKLSASSQKRKKNLIISHLIWLTARFPNLCYYDISINIPVHLWISLYSNKAVFLAVIEPMACPSSSDDSLKLIGLNPNDLLNTLVTPKLQTARTISMQRNLAFITLLFTEQELYNFENTTPTRTSQMLTSPPTRTSQMCPKVNNTSFQCFFLPTSF